ncbi:MAG: Fe-S cluster assembly protein SufD [Phormidesmis sp.]
MSTAKGMTGAATPAIATKRETYLKHLLTQAAAAADESNLGLKDLRDRAIAQVNQTSFPSGRDEEWRFTDLADMLALPFERAIAQKRDSATAPSAAFFTHLTALENSFRLTTLNGLYALELSIEGRFANAPELPEGAVVAPLSALIAHPQYGQKVSKIITDRLAQVPGGSEVFTALNTAGFSDVMVIWLRADQVIREPICIARASTGKLISHLRTLVIAERHSSCTLIESFEGDGEQPRCNNSVTEIILEEGANVDHIRLQDEGAKTFHLAKTAVSQAANSRYSCTAIDLGAQLSRHHLEIYPTGPQTDTHLYGLSALQGRQLADTHSLVSLKHPNSTTTQIQKNVVDDRAHAVFNGKVYVSQAAQSTNASQLNRNLMLSSKARIDTKPELDIVADNVKCAHGATVSQLQADEVFYLQSRGISADQAQRLLLYGFAMEIVEKVSVEPLRQILSRRINQTMKYE